MRPAGATKLVLVVIDGLGRELFDQALTEGRLPTIAALLERGTLHPPCASAFPSLTPVCLSAIATGALPDRSFIPGLTWFRRGEGRFVEYGSSFAATLAEGTIDAINDAVMNLNHLHLSQRERTLFELVEDAGLVAGSVNYYVFRGRKRHTIKLRPVGALARRIGVFDAAYGPTRFFMGELFESDRVQAPRNVGIHGRNDDHAAAIGRWLVARDGFDFLLFYLPEVDAASHRRGPHGILDVVEQADASVAALVDAAGGADGFLERYGLILCADHGQTAVRSTCEVRSGLADLRLFRSSWEDDPDRCQVAVAASNRAAMLYRLADAPPARALAARAERVGGVDVACFAEEGWYVARRGGVELRFRRDTRNTAGDAALRDARGGRWLLAGDRGALELVETGGVVSSSRYPNALERIAGVLDCVNAGEVVLSAGRGVEFVDAGGSHHIGGGSHGSLAADDSLVPLVTVGVDTSQLPPEPAITDVFGLVRRHLGV